MKPIFGSLGSNYSWNDAAVSLGGLVQRYLAPRQLQSLHRAVCTQLSDEFGGTTFLFYKGRDAIECALRAYGVSASDSVITQAFACYAVEEGIARSGAVSVYADIQKGSLNLSVETIAAAAAAAIHPVKAVVVQYSLGSLPDIKAIAAWCSARNIVLIEDLAQSYGAVTAEGKKLGMYGDVVVCSFGRDKIVDAVSGGACTFRTLPKKKLEHISSWYSQLQTNLSASVVLRDHFYPALTVLIRATATWGVRKVTLGSLLTFCAKKAGLMRSPLYAPTASATALPVSYLPLLQRALNGVSSQLEHRKQRAEEYAAFFSKESLVLTKEVLQGSALRYPVFVENPEKASELLKKQAIHLTDRWYRAAVDCSTVQCSTVYTAGTAPNAEEAAKHVLTLPTHRGISSEDVQRISTMLQKVSK